MAVNNVSQKYIETQVNTASQGKLIVMLYDGAIKFINKALEHIDKKEIEATHNNIIKVQDIITELITSLNMEAGDISQKLFSIYMYINRQLSLANIKKSKDPLIEVKKHLTELRGAWEEANKKVSSPNVQNNGGINIAT
jgi:flagellar protein FliS